MITSFKGLSHNALFIVPLALAMSLIAVYSQAGASESQAAPQTPAEYGERAVQVYLDDLPITFPISPFLQDEITMVPLRALSEALGFTVTWQETGSVVCERDGASVTLSIGNSMVKAGSGEVTLPQPPSLAGDYAVVPLRFFSEAMGFTVDWDPATYTAWVSSPKSPMPVWGFYALGSAGYSSWDELFGDSYPYPLELGPDAPASQVAGAILGWYALDEDGKMTCEENSSGYFRPDGWQAVMMRLKMGGARAVAMYFADNTEGRLSQLLCDPVRSQTLAMSIASTASSFDGIALDFEGLGLEKEKRESDAANFAAFIDTLKRYIRDLPLTVALPPLNGAYLGYDHERIGEIADSVILMAYGYEEPEKPSATAPWARVDEAIRLELEKVPAEKLVLGIPAYGTVYAVTAEGTKRTSLPAARDPVGPAEKSYDPCLACDYSTWTDGDTTYHAYTESNRSLQARVALAKRYGLGGVACWRLGLLQEGWLDVLLDVAEPLR